MIVLLREVVRMTVLGGVERTADNKEGWMKGPFQTERGMDGLQEGELLLDT